MVLKTGNASELKKAEYLLTQGDEFHFFHKESIMNHNNQAGAYVQQQQEMQRQRDEQQRQFQQSLDNQNRMYQQQREQNDRQQQIYAQQQADRAASSRRLNEEWERSQRNSTSTYNGYSTGGNHVNRNTHYANNSDTSNPETGSTGGLLAVVGLLIVGYLFLWPIVFPVIQDAFK